MTWWGSWENPSDRMRREALTMKATFDIKKRVLIRSHVSWDQDFYLETGERKFVTDKPRYPYWLITFRMHDSSSSRIRSKEWFTIRIEYPEGYPDYEPEVRVISHDVTDAPHVLLFSSGALCLHDHTSSRSGWDPGKSTAATFGLWAIEWIRAYLYWKKTWFWPETA